MTGPVCWTCCRCGRPLTAMDDVHDDPDPPPGTDGDVCHDCCPCTDPGWIVATTPGGTKDDLGIDGHPGPTADQAARAEAHLRGPVAWADGPDRQTRLHLPGAA